MPWINIWTILFVFFLFSAPNQSYIQVSYQHQLITIKRKPQQLVTKDAKQQPKKLIVLIASNKNILTTTVIFNNLRTFRGCYYYYFFNYNKKTFFFFYKQWDVFAKPFFIMLVFSIVFILLFDCSRRIKKFALNFSVVVVVGAFCYGFFVHGSFTMFFRKKAFFLLKI